MTKQEFYEITGEDPEDVIGPNWEDEVEIWLHKEGYDSDDGV